MKMTKKFKGAVPDSSVTMTVGDPPSGITWWATPATSVQVETLKLMQESIVLQRESVAMQREHLDWLKSKRRR